MVDIVDTATLTASVVEVDTPTTETPVVIAEEPVAEVSDEVSSEVLTAEGSVNDQIDEAPEKVTEIIDEKKRALLEGPLSNKPSTRFRQLLARPGIIVSSDFPILLLSDEYMH